MGQLAFLTRLGSLGRGGLQASWGGCLDLIQSEAKTFRLLIGACVKTIRQVCESGRNSYFVNYHIYKKKTPLTIRCLSVHRLVQ